MKLEKLKTLLQTYVVPHVNYRDGAMETPWVDTRAGSSVHLACKELVEAGALYAATETYKSCVYVLSESGRHLVLELLRPI